MIYEGVLMLKENFEKYLKQKYCGSNLSRTDRISEKNSLKRKYFIQLCTVECPYHETPLHRDHTLHPSLNWN